jgi:hypothetical protein
MGPRKVLDDAMIRARLIVRAIDQTIADVTERNEAGLDEKIKVLQDLRERMLARSIEDDVRT